ncbi:glycoside hydrolase family 78 protein [Zalerion maritima]|uniref:Glycoside hydrolase family 78 protein n=1 Tax=Zalerion maritima TaxID=339359 RepID=A0AAD5WUN8_9PEZI|nr:glycoside hydrolase family 78 protein [Zalerion maritima]
MPQRASPLLRDILVISAIALSPLLFLTLFATRDEYLSAPLSYLRSLPMYQTNKHEPSAGQEPHASPVITEEGSSSRSIQQVFQDHSSIFTDTNWHRFVSAPNSNLVPPQSIVSSYTSGHVRNADSLITGCDRPVILTRWAETDDEPVIVLDFGRNVVGLAVIEFEGSRKVVAGKTEQQKGGDYGNLPGANSGNAGGYEDELHRPGLRLSFSETLEFLGKKSDFSRSYNIRNPSNKLTPGSDQIAVPPHASTWTSQTGCQHAPTKQVCSDGLHGFRYLRISLSSLISDGPFTSPLGQISISSIRLRLSAFLGTPPTFTGHFQCSDTNLTSYWYAGVYTNDLCTDVFRANDTEPRDALSASLVGKLVLHDGAKRDRDPYVGDLAVAGPTAYLSRKYEDGGRGVENVLVDLAEHQREEDGWIPPASIMSYSLRLFDYPLWWVVCVYKHVLYTDGDNSSSDDTRDDDHKSDDFVTKMYPSVKRVLDNYYPSTTNDTLGLLQKGMGMQSSNGYGDYAFLPRKGVVTYYNALYVLALRYAAELSAHPRIGLQEEDGNRWNERADSVAEALRNFSWDDEKGAFWDGQCEARVGAKGKGEGGEVGQNGDDGERDCGEQRTREWEWCPTHAQDGNSLAILSGIATGARQANSDLTKARSILSHLTSTTFRQWGNAFYDSPHHGPQFSNRVYPFISHFEVLSRFLVPGFTPSALDQLRRTYSTMADPDKGGPGTFWEGIGYEGRAYEEGFTSMAHGWSTGVVSSLTEKVLGVEPTGRGWGYQSWRVKPLGWEGMTLAPDDGHEGREKFEHVPITWAKGVVPTPRGKIGVSWRLVDSEGDTNGREKGNMTGENTERIAYALSVSAPRGTEGEIWLPLPPRNGGSAFVTQVVVARHEEIISEHEIEVTKELRDENEGTLGSGYFVVKGVEDWDGEKVVYFFRVSSTPLGATGTGGQPMVAGQATRLEAIVRTQATDAVGDSTSAAVPGAASPRCSYVLLLAMLSGFLVMRERIPAASGGGGGRT